MLIYLDYKCKTQHYVTLLASVAVSQLLKRLSKHAHTQGEKRRERDDACVNLERIVERRDVRHFFVTHLFLCNFIVWCDEKIWQTVDKSKPNHRFVVWMSSTHTSALGCCVCIVPMNGARTISIRHDGKRRRVNGFANLLAASQMNSWKAKLINLKSSSSSQRNRSIFDSHWFAQESGIEQKSHVISVKLIVDFRWMMLRSIPITIAMWHHLIVQAKISKWYLIRTVDCSAINDDSTIDRYWLFIVWLVNGVCFLSLDFVLYHVMYYSHSYSSSQILNCWYLLTMTARLTWKNCETTVQQANFDRPRTPVW